MKLRLLYCIFLMLLFGGFTIQVSAQQIITAPSSNRHKPKPKPKKRVPSNRTTQTSMAVHRLISQKVTLKDGEVWYPLIYGKDTLFTTKKKEQEIASKYAKSMISSPILRALGVADFAENIIETFQNQCLGMYNSLQYSGVYSWGKFNKFLHEIIKLPEVRKWGIKMIGDFLVDFCKYYPKDFQKQTIADLQQFLSRINDMEVNNYTLDDRNNLYINGKREYELPHKLEGFVVRRVLVDKIPASEMKAYIQSILKRVQSVNTAGNPEVLVKYTLNNEVDFCISASGNYYYFKRRDIKIVPYKEDKNYPYEWCRRRRCTRVKYFSNGSEGYYDIETGNLYGSEWTKAVKSAGWRVLVESSGEVIVQE